MDDVFVTVRLRFDHASLWPLQLSLDLLDVLVAIALDQAVLGCFLSARFVGLLET